MKGSTTTTNKKGFWFLGKENSDGLSYSIQPTFEAHISSETANAQDSMSAGLPVTLDWSQGRSQIDHWFLTVSPDYEFDRLMNNETIGGDVFLTANWPSIGIGQYIYPFGKPKKGFEPDYALRFHWRPYIGVEGGHVIKAQSGTVLSEENEYARLATKLHADLGWSHKNTTSKGSIEYRDSKFVVSVDYYFRQDLTGGCSSHNYVEVSPTLYLDANEYFSVGLTYKNGETTPKFASVDELTLWLGIKF